MKRVALLAAIALSCGSTGSDRFEFEARARGVTPASFTNSNGWVVTLAKADFTIGPVYLKSAASRDASRSVGEVLDQVTVDALSPAPAVFALRGTMTEAPVRSGEVWFWPAPGIAPETTKIATAAADLAGTAVRGGALVRFHGRLVLDDAWASTARPGEHAAQPISDVRKAHAIPADFSPQEGGALEIRVDARGLLAGADFAALDADGGGDGGEIELKPTDQVMKTAFAGLRAARGTWEIEWINR